VCPCQHGRREIALQLDVKEQAEVEQIEEILCNVEVGLVVIMLMVVVFGGLGLIVSRGGVRGELVVVGD
jgi:hypothetical protein